MLVGILDSQVRVIADKQVAQITADRKALPPISFKPLQRTSLMIRTCIDLGTDHLQCENQRLTRIDAAPCLASDSMADAYDRADL